jgi:hypothetical protein
VCLDVVILSEAKDLLSEAKDLLSEAQGSAVESLWMYATDF